MSLATVKTHLDTLFKKIGTEKDKHTAPPESKENRASIAWEYFISDFGCSYWKKRREKAKKLAEEVGLLVPNDPGETLKCYGNEFLEIVAKTNQPSSRLDEQMLLLKLVREQKMALPAAQHFINSCKLQNAPATTYSVVSPEITQ